jgi:integrase
MAVAAQAWLALNFHQLRHGAATLMIAKSIPLKLIQEIPRRLGLRPYSEGWVHV